MAEQDLNKARAILSGPKGLFDGIRLCMRTQHVGSALVLVYSLIDVLAWLGLPETEKYTTREGFISWADRYIIPNGPIDCSGSDLYGARCGVLHTFAPDSSRAEAGLAIPIVYAWGSSPPYRNLQNLGLTFVMLHIDTLCAAVERGAEQFWREVENDPAQLAAVNQRAEKIFQNKQSLFET